jgi:hypothetical protein
MRDGSRRRSWAALIITRGALVRLAALAAVIVIALLVLYRMTIPMPGQRYDGLPPEPTMAQLTTAERLERDVVTLAATIGRRNVFRLAMLHEAERWLTETLQEMGYEVTRQEYAVSVPSHRVFDALSANLIVELSGSELKNEIIIIGAHYDSVLGSPGANDNASGVAATLELARRFAGATPRRTLRFCFFTNEEMPFFQTPQMGSWVYAKSLRERSENVVGMISLETIGYYSDEPDSQKYPAPLHLLYPSEGNFIGFVSNVRSRRLLRKAVEAFRDCAEIPSEGGAIFGGIPGVGWSDHWAFWQEGYAALMVTDTAPFRYAHYHMPTDTPDKLDYERMARVVDGMEHVVRVLSD